MYDYTQLPVVELIPHSPPMVLLERVIECGDLNLKAELCIEQDSMFYDDAIKGVPAWVGIEYMAQAIAAFAGIHAKMKNEEIKLGFLLGTRKYHIHEQVFQVNQKYQIDVKRLYIDESGLSSFECAIFHNNQIIIQSRLNVYETDDADSIIK
ncbi:MAG: hotdog family protein [Gammaproteobacteria bacterium]|nr:hotdog family protein [Gammaproteobacteria bacterium]